MCGFNFDTTYTELPSQFFTMQNVDQVVSPKIVIVNHELANFLGLNFRELDQITASTIIFWKYTS